MTSNENKNMALLKTCPSCGHEIPFYRNPVPTVDVVIFIPGQGVVLVARKNPPPGWALPGGFVDYGETVERAAVREAFEETGLAVTLTGLVGVYSDPKRDPRMHTISVVYTAEVANPKALNAGDDAAEARIFPLDKLPAKLAFDHGQILKDFVASLGGRDASGP